MAEETAFENRRISNFEELMTLNLTLDWVILHTVMYHSSTSTYRPNFIEIKESFQTHFIRSTQKSRPKTHTVCTAVTSYILFSFNW